MTLILIVAGLTLFASFSCSLLEATLYSLTPARIAVLQERGIPRANRLAKLKANIEDPIAAILTINTIAHTIGAAWCGALVGELYGSRAVGVFAAVFTFLVLAVTEIVPKSLGVRYADKLGPHIALPLQVMVWSVFPVAWLAKKAIHALAGSAEQSHPSEDEVITTAQLAASGGRMRQEEHRWVKNALRLDRVTAGDLRTPRTVVEMHAADTSILAIVRNPGAWIHSRIPITDEGHMDRILGLVHRREVSDAALCSRQTDRVLRDLMRPIHFVPEAMPAHTLLDLFLDKRSHLAAVIDEYGGFQGVVALEDVLECLLGEEIVDEHDREADMQVHASERSRSRLAKVESWVKSGYSH